jgi:hypothetical protein
VKVGGLHRTRGDGCNGAGERAPEVSINFKPIHNNDSGAVEFRHPPGVKTVQQAQN